MINAIDLFRNLFLFFRYPHTCINYKSSQANDSEENDIILAADKTEYSQDLHSEDDGNYLTLPYKIGKLYPAINIIAIVLILTIVVFAVYFIFSTSDLGLICLILFLSLCFAAPLLIFIILQNQTILFSDRAIVNQFWSKRIILYKDIRGIEAYKIDNSGGAISVFVRIIYLTKAQKYKVLIPEFPVNSPATKDGLVLLIKVVSKLSPQLQLNGLAEEIVNNNFNILEANRLIELNPEDANAYINRGNLKKDKLNDIPGALADYNQAIELNPQDPIPYMNRGIIKGYNLNDISGALADYDRAIELNPQYDMVYYNRGLLKKEKLNDKIGAIEDFQQVVNLSREQDDMSSYQYAIAIDRLIELNPQDAVSYNNRGVLKHNSNDIQGTLADYNKAIELNPQDANTYKNRGILKQNNLNDIQGALADYNQAIRLWRGSANELNLQSAGAYYNRGILKKDQLNDKIGAIKDFQQAANLYQKQDDMSSYQYAIDRLIELHVSK